ncbi:serine protease [Aspergillus stella-maris]|uniref:serine protease n=1 Tax=Aspergillus stella-maris TaxID=1810926 RepID=UPI003CCD9A49
MKSSLSILQLLLTASAGVLANEDIVGGSNARITDFPYQVSIQQTAHKCGGTILDANHILTAAHCVSNNLDNPSRLRVRAGSVRHASGGTHVNVARIISHPEYDAATVANDIAVLRLAQSLEFGSTIAPVQLPSSESDTPATGDRCSVTGWGATSEGGSLPSLLNVVYLNIIAHKECVEGYADRNPVDDNMICAGALGGGKDACQGDSGGPLVDTASGKQVGIVSWGFGCGRPGHDGVYASTAAYLGWIQEAVLLELL